MTNIAGDAALNERGCKLFPPGHFYSPLLDIAALGESATSHPCDDESYWEHVDLRPDAQRAYYERLKSVQSIQFPQTSDATFRYHWKNDWFPYGDAFSLSAIMQLEKPRRIIEVGSGFSSAVMLDTRERTDVQSELTFIEPHPERLQSLLSDADEDSAEIIVGTVQEVSVGRFDQLESGDILFIDSSHVAKVGSDVVHLLLRVLPRLNPGVIVHVHDLFYPISYPMAWIQDGNAWNESLFLRAFLVGNDNFEVLAFNQFIAATAADLFDSDPKFLSQPGGSFWMRKI